MRIPLEIFADSLPLKNSENEMVAFEIMFVINYAVFRRIQLAILKLRFIVRVFWSLQAIVWADNGNVIGFASGDWTGVFANLYCLLRDMAIFFRDRRYSETHQYCASTKLTRESAQRKRRKRRRHDCLCVLVRLNDALIDSRFALTPCIVMYDCSGTGGLQSFEF